MKRLFIIACMLCFFILPSCQSNESNNADTPPSQDAAHDHVYTSTVIVPSCTEDGYTLYRCSLCDEQYSDQIVKARGHDYKESFQDAPCNQYQKKCFECSVCQHTYHEDLETKGTLHNYVTTVVAPTCTEDGYTLHRCSLCNDQYSDQTVKASGHDYKESFQDANCNEYQKKRFECSVCHDTYHEDLETKGTIHVYISTVTPPDRENKGYTTHQCKNCSESYVDNYTDPVDYSVGLAYKRQSGGYYVVGIGTCKDTDVVIPATSENGYRVVGILANAFANSNVKSIIVSDGVTDIQSGAFRDCSKLESVTLSKDANPSEDIFFNTPVLAKLTMPMKKPIAFYFHYPMGGEYKTLEQGDGSISGTYYGAIPLSLREVNLLNSPCASVLSGCDMLTKITIAPTATEIGAFAFRNCTGLTEISIPASVKSIGGYSFAATSISSITIPDNVVFTMNDIYIFEGCLQLTQVKLPQKSTCLPAYMFLNCVKLKQLEIPNGVTMLGGSIIAGTGVESLTLPEGLTAIESHTFSDCKSLKEVVLPKSLKTIGYSAFANCSSLKKVVFSTSLEEIGHEAFIGCTSLEELILPSNLKTIDYAAFKNCTALKHVELPAKIEQLSTELFFGCTSILEITLPSRVISIQNSVFEESGLVSVTIPESIVRVGTRIFANCKSLKSVVFAGDNTPIENEMFLGAVSLQSIQIPKNVTQIPVRFCQGATALKTIIFNEGLLTIKEEAFLGCTSLESVTFPTTLKSFWARAFKGCTALKSIDFSGAKMSEEASITGVEWFADCTALTEIKNHDGLRYINESIFRNTPLQVVENGMTITLGWLLKVSPEQMPRVVRVPNGVTKICDSVFSACDHIEEVILPEGVTYLGMRIFGSSDSSSLVKITLPDSLAVLPSDTFCLLPHIEEIVVGKGLQQIDGTFFGNLKTIRFRGTIEEFKQMPWCENSGVAGVTVICTNGTVAQTQQG